MAAVAATAAAAVPGTAGAASGGIGTTTTSTTTPSPSPGYTPTRYDRLWNGFALRDRRWAHRTSECESGSDPQAIGGGGIYRGAFQFMRSTWKGSPKSPGGDPIAYPYRTQAVVAVLLMHREGTDHWPVCG